MNVCPFQTNDNRDSSPLLWVLISNWIDPGISNVFVFIPRYLLLVLWNSVCILYGDKLDKNEYVVRFHKPL